MRLRCDLLLALGDAQRRAGNASYRETVAKAVDVARALGDGERLALAVLGHARPGGFVASANVVDEGLIGPLRGGERRARRSGQPAARACAGPACRGAHLHRRSASGGTRSRARRSRSRGGSATRSASAQALNLRLLAINDPFTLAERLDLTAELAALAARVGSSELAWHAACASRRRAARVGRHRRCRAVPRRSRAACGRAAATLLQVVGPDRDGRCSPSCAARPTPRQRHSRPSSWAWPGASPMRRTCSALSIVRPAE